jgi:hypothetical protein
MPSRTLRHLQGGEDAVDDAPAPAEAATAGEGEGGAGEGDRGGEHPLVGHAGEKTDGADTLQAGKMSAGFVRHVCTCSK